MGDLQFYSTVGPTGFLSNFARFGFDLDGHHWSTSEHYYQARKFTEGDDWSMYSLRIRDADTPSEAARLGRNRHHPMREDWEQVKEAVMMRALRAKFAAHPGIRDRLIETAPRRLVEHTVKDRYWADGGDGGGQNRLGELLMALRAELLADQI